MNTRKDKRIFNFEFIQNYPFWTYVKKIQHIHFWVHGHFSLSTFGLHLVRGPKAL